MFDPRTISMLLTGLLLLHLSSAFYLMEDRYKKKTDEYEEVETITDPVKVKLLMSQPGKQEVRFTPVIIPDKFSKYDSIDHDGHITLKELIRTTGAERNAKNAFQAADKDADGEISQEEFKLAPWAMKPTSEDSKDDQDYIDEAKFENVTIEEEEVGRDGEGGENIEEQEEEGDEERNAEKVGEGEKHKEGGEESPVGNVVEKDEVRGENGRRDEEGDQKVIIEKDEKEGLEGDLKEAEGGVEPVGKESKVGVEEVKEKKVVGGVDRKVEVGEESEAGGEGETEKKVVRGVDRKVEVDKAGGEGETEKTVIGGEEGKTEKKVVGGGEEGEGAMEKIENTEHVRNESAGVGGGKEGESKEKEENREDEEKGKEADNAAESKVENEEYIEIEDLETHIHGSDHDIVDPHEFGTILDKIDDELEELDNLIVDDLENNELIDIEETSGQLIENDDNEESYTVSEHNFNMERYESFTD